MHKAPKFVAGDGQSFDRGYDRSSYYRSVDNEVMRDRVFVSSTIEDLQEERDTLGEYLSSRGFCSFMSEGAHFPHPGASEKHSHDHCIDQALQCGSVVFLIGSRVDWPYNGDKYAGLAREITEQVERDAGLWGFKPSISLVEFYSMVRSGKKCYAVVSTGAYSRITRETISDEDKALKTEYQFINHLKVHGSAVGGNWLSQFDSVDDLINRVSGIEF